MSTLAKASFELLKWRVFWGPHLQEAVSVILSSANDSNWRIRSATLTYLRTFMYRYDTYFGYLPFRYDPLMYVSPFLLGIPKYKPNSAFGVYIFGVSIFYFESIGTSKLLFIKMFSSILYLSAP